TFSNTSPMLLSLPYSTLVSFHFPTISFSSSSLSNLMLATFTSTFSTTSSITLSQCLIIRLIVPPSNRSALYTTTPPIPPPPSPAITLMSYSTVPPSIITPPTFTPPISIRPVGAFCIVNVTCTSGG